MEIDSFGIWIALFALGLVGLIMLVFYSRKMKMLEKKHQEVLQQQRDVEAKQALFLADIGENMHSIVEEKFQISSATSCQLTEEDSLRRERLFNASSTLIDFLRLKSKKIEIVNEAFNFNNVLNEVSGQISSTFKGSKVELVFDIDHSVPRLLVGDSLKLEKILNGLLEYALDQTTQGEVKLSISTYQATSDQMKLRFRLSDTSSGVSALALSQLFTPVYNEESKSYEGIGLYVVKEHIEIMGGEISVQSVVGQGTSFEFSLPFEVGDGQNQRKYRLPKKLQGAKRVLIVDRSDSAAQAIKKLFLYFGYSVDVVREEKFLELETDFSPYDIVLLNEGLMTWDLIVTFSEIKAKKLFKLIVLNSQLGMREEAPLHEVVDRRLLKPLNQERIFELTTDLYFRGEKPLSSTSQTPHNTETFVKVYHGEIQETKGITQESFNLFAGMRLLITEDNIVNQKVLLNVLKHSGVKITVANNGQEAVQILSKATQAYDFVLMDINMPIMDGFVATKKIRREAKFDQLPIVAFTALALESERQKVFDAGMNAFLCKPLNIGKLYTVFELFSDGFTQVKGEGEVLPLEAKEILDTKRGVDNTNNNRAFYIEILKEFLDAYGKSGREFEKLVRAEQFDALEKLCLDMKGLTGTIGADRMHEVMVMIHKAIVGGEYITLPHYTKSYTTALNELEVAIRGYISQ